MVIMHGLRILTDLAFYYAFASIISVCSGGRYALAGLLVQSVCFTLSAALRKSKWLRLAVLLPMGLLWLLPDIGLADRLLFLPPAVYLLWQAWKDSYPLEWGRQVELFSVFWKAYSLVSVFLVLAGMLKQLSAASIPCGLVMLVCSVLLMRALRHEPVVYCQRRYQLVNLASVAVVMAVAAFISSEVFLQGCLDVLRAVYNGVALPVLELLLVILFGVLTAVAWLVSFLNIRLPEGGETVRIQLQGVAEELGLEDMIQQGTLGRKVLMALVILAAAVLLYVFFRWMHRLSYGEKTDGAAREERKEAETAAVKKEKLPRFGSPVQRVRAQYRKFLKLYLSAGGGIENADTSLDVDTGAKKHRFDPAATGELRELYIRARYAGEADEQDAARAKELCSAMKKDRG